MRTLVLLLAALCLFATAFAEPVPVTLLTVNGDRYFGTLLFSDGVFTVKSEAGDKQVRGELADRLDLPPFLEMPEEPYQCAVLTRCGDTFDAFFADLLLEDAVAFSLPETGLLDVPWTKLKGIIYYGSTRNKAEETALKDKLRSSEPQLDEIGLANGDVLSGAVIELNSTAVRAEAKGKELTIPAEEMRYVIFARVKELREPGEPEDDVVETGWYSGIRTTFGNYLTLKLSSIDGEKLKGTLLLGGEVEIGLTKLISVEFANGAAVRLTSMTPSTVDQRPFFHKVWNWRLNKSVSDKPLKMKGKTWDNGFGTHAYTRLEFKLAKAYTHFTTTVGIDEGSAGRGTVVFRVLGDGRKLWESAVMKPGEVESIRVEISDVEVLALETDFGGDDDLGDHGNWCDPKVIRKVERGEERVAGMAFAAPSMLVR